MTNPEGESFDELAEEALKDPEVRAAAEKNKRRREKEWKEGDKAIVTVDGYEYTCYVISMSEVTSPEKRDGKGDLCFTEGPGGLLFEMDVQARRVK